MKATMWVRQLNRTENTAEPETVQGPTVVDSVSATQEANRIVDNFNRTLRPYEVARVLVRVEFTGEPDDPPPTTYSHETCQNCWDSVTWEDGTKRPEVCPYCNEPMVYNDDEAVEDDA